MSKAVIFDMDGVICHTNPFHSMAFKEFFAKRNLFPTEEEFCFYHPKEIERQEKQNNLYEDIQKNG